MHWDILALWLREPGDEGQTYEQRTSLKPPGSQPEIEAVVEFEMLQHRQNVIANVTGFPVGVPGEAVVVLSYRRSGPGNEWQEVAQYPVQVTHQITPVAPVLPEFDKV